MLFEITIALTYPFLRGYQYPYEKKDLKSGYETKRYLFLVLSCLKIYTY